MYTVSPNNSTTSLSDEDVDDVDVQDMKVSFHYPKDVHPDEWASSLTRVGSVEQYSPSSPIKSSISLPSLLPPEILIHVLRQLHSTRDLYHALLVSRTWCSCAVELLWHRPSFQALPQYHRMLDVITSKSPTTFEYASFIRRLNFAFIASEITDALFTPLSVCTRLERLTLVGCTELSDAALLEVLPHMHNMVALDLSNIPHLSDAPVVAIAKAAPKLQGINLSGCKNITDDAVSAIAESCPFIRRVKLFNVRLVTDSSIMALAHGCPVLLEIDLNGCPKITDFSTRDLWTQCPQLRELRLSQCDLLSDLGFPATPPPILETPNTLVLTQPNGRQIEVQPFPVAQAAMNVDIMAPLRLNRIAEHLRILDLTACALLTDDAIAGIVSTAPKLRNLVLAKCPQLTDTGVESICKLGKHLHYLHLGHAVSITDRSVRLLARWCTRLRYIDLACCPLLTDLSVFELSVLPKLRRIGLVRVTNLTDQAIFSLADRHSTLERIHLSYCEHISVLAIHFLLQRLVKLTHLSLTGVPAFRRPELQKFCRSPPGEFNTTQRAAFCVYSGKGVNDLRKYLSELFVHVHSSEADNDTDYDDDEDGPQSMAKGMSAAEMYVEQQRERDRARGRGRRERGRLRYIEDHIASNTAFTVRQARYESPATARPMTVGSNGTVIAAEEIFEEDARTPLSRFSPSLLSSLPRNVTVRRGHGIINEHAQQPEAGPSTGVVFAEETKASSLATTPSPTEQHPNNVANGAIPSEDARPSPPRNFADSPIVESSAPTPAIDSTQRFHTAFFQYPTYGSGFRHENTRRTGEGGRVNGTFSNPTSVGPTGPLSTFTPPDQSASPVNGRSNVYTPDYVLSTLGNRRPLINRSISDTGFGGGSATPGMNGNSPSNHLEDDDELSTSGDAVPLQYPYRYYQQLPDDSPTALATQALMAAHEQRERQRQQKDSSRSKRRQHGANSPIPYLSSSPTTKELQESVHSAFANGTSFGVSSANGEETSSGFGDARSSLSAYAAETAAAPGPVSAESSRGRSARRSWKNTFSAAENYASALFFGRGAATGSGNVSSASSSSGREGGRAS